jgi:hypothetical protein
MGKNYKKLEILEKQGEDTQPPSCNIGEFFIFLEN